MYGNVCITIHYSAKALIFSPPGHSLNPIFNTFDKEILHSPISCYLACFMSCDSYLPDKKWTPLAPSISSSAKILPIHILPDTVLPVQQSCGLLV